MGVGWGGGAGGLKIEKKKRIKNYNVVYNIYIVETVVISISLPLADQWVGVGCGE